MQGDYSDLIKTVLTNQHVIYFLGEEVDLKRYPATAEGMITSWVERFPNTDVDELLEQLAEKDSSYFLELKAIANA